LLLVASRGQQDQPVARLAEYYRDPSAPPAQGLLAAAYAVVRDDSGRILLVRRADDLNWELPGGRIDVGESATEAAVREVGEEAGIAIDVVGLAGVYSDPAHVLVYRDEGVRQQVAICFHARPAPTPAGPAVPDGRPDNVETVAVMWADPQRIPSLQVHPAVRQRLSDTIGNPHLAHFD
jgi:8-oxo-dGTP pyrophosphatase MutT (NUDIX family)